MGGNDHVNGAASRLPRGHRSTKVSIAISEVYGERPCRFPSAAQYAADSDRIKNRLYDHRNLRTHSLCRILLWPRPRASLQGGGSATRRVSWSRSSGTLKKASWRARARQVPFLRPLWGGLNTRTRPTRAAYTRARVIQGASEPTTNIACRAYSCTARRRCSPTKATKWREASRAVREARLASHDCRGPTPPQPRNTSRAMHANAVAP